MTGIILRTLITALGLWLATEWVDGVYINSALTLIGAGLLLGLVNAFVRPVAFILTLPLTVITLGLFLLVLNTAMLGLVALLLPGFDVTGFWPAFWSALLVSLTSWVASWLIGSRGKFEVIRRGS